MKVINERYIIEKEIKTSQNSISYLAKDKMTNEYVLLKLLNRNVINEYPLHLFIREYLINKLYFHPLLKEFMSYEKIYNIDGKNITSDEYFFISKNYDKKNNFDVKYLYNCIINVAYFLFKNSLYHGDINLDKITSKTDNTIVLYDINALFDTKTGQNKDIEDIYSLFSEKLKMEEFHNYDLNYFLNSKYINKNLQKELIYKHLLMKNFPIFIFSSKEEIKKIIDNYNLINFFSIFDTENAIIYSENILPYFEIKNFLILKIDFLLNTFFNLGERILSFFWELESNKEFIKEFGGEFVKIKKDLPFKSTESLSNYEAETNKLIEFIFFLLEKNLNQIQLLIWIKDFKALDKVSVDFLKKFNKRFDKNKIKILLNNNEPLDFCDNVEVNNLDFEKFTKVIDFYFYFYKINNSSLSNIFKITNGEYRLLKIGFEKIAEDKGIIIRNKEIFFKNSENYYFNYINSIKNTINKLSKDEKNFLEILTFFDGSILQDYFDTAADEYKFNIQLLIEKDLLIISNQNYKFKYLFLNDYFNDINEDNYLIDYFISILPKKLYEDFNLLKPYQRLEFFRKNYNQCFENIWKIYSYFNENNLIFDKYAFSEIFMEFYKIEEEINENNRFNLYYGYFATQKQISEPEKLLDKMDKYKKNILDEYIRLSFYLNIKKVDLEEIKNYFFIFDNINFPNEKIWQSLANKIILSLYNLNAGNIATKIFEEKLLKKLDNLSLYSQLSFMVNMEIIYDSLKNKEMTSYLAEKFIALLKENENKLTDDLKIRIFFNYARYLISKNEYNEGLKYYNICSEIAEKMKDYELLMSINNSIATLYYRMEEFKKMLEFLKKTFNFAKICPNAEILFFVKNNLVTCYLNNLEFDEILPLIESNDNIDIVKHESKKNYFYSRFAYVYMLLGEKDKIQFYLDKSSSFFEKNYKSDFGLEYFIVKFYFIYKYEGASAGRKYLAEINEKLKVVNSLDVMNIFYFKICYLLFYFKDKILLKKYFSLLIKEKFNKKDKMLIDVFDSYIFKRKIDLSSLCISNFSEKLHELMFYSIFLEVNKKKDYYYQEFFVRYSLIISNIRKNLPEKYKLSFENYSIIYLKYLDILKKDKNYNEKFYYKLLNKYRIMQINKTKNYLNNAEFLIIKKFDLFIKNAIKEFMEITGFQRGIFFKYELDAGFKKIIEVKDDLWFTDKEEEYIEDIINKSDIENEGKINIWENSENLYKTEISKAISFPVVDISNFRKITKKDYFSNLYSIIGYFYFDTKSKINIPTDEDISKLLYFREYINASFYYNKLIDSVLLDNLTKLYKKENWINLVKEKMAYLIKNNKKFCILLSDIDYFKNINDTYGHKMGDLILSKVAEISMNTIRSIDIAGRYGGEEFVFCITNADKEQGFLIAERIRKKIENENFNLDRKITISIGLACYPDDGVLLNELIEKADQALIFAKNNGRNLTVKWEINKININQNIQKNTIISNPSREKEKVDLIINLLTCVDYSSKVENVFKAIFKLLNENYELQNIGLLKKKENKINFYFINPLNENNNLDLLPEKIGDFIYRVAYFYDKRNNLEYALYFAFDSVNIKFDLEATYFKFIGKFILEKIVLYDKNN